MVEELQGGAVTRQYTYGLQRITENQPISNALDTEFLRLRRRRQRASTHERAGAVTDTYEYDAFGNVLSANGTTPNNYLYRGEQYDPDLGLYYLRARYYNPAHRQVHVPRSEDAETHGPGRLHKYLYAKAIQSMRSIQQDMKKLRNIA